MTPFWTATWDALAGALFPTPCVSCRRLIEAHDPPLCTSCWARIPAFSGPACDCGEPGFGPSTGGCGRCRRGRSVISRGVSLGPYGGPLRDCVVALKYQGRHRAAERLAARLLSNPRCREILNGADLLIGVPLHKDRLRRRGFNQAELLARSLAKAGPARLSNCLIRVRDTRSQTDLSARERRRNVAKAFSVRSARILQDATVVLVDDVTTTGATIRECAMTLLAGGAREVRSVTVARAE